MKNRRRIDKRLVFEPLENRHLLAAAVAGAVAWVDCHAEVNDDVPANYAEANLQRQVNPLVAVARESLQDATEVLLSIHELVSFIATASHQSEPFPSALIASIQLQMDSSLESIDRLAQTTTFQGTRIGDGRLDFELTGVDDQRLKMVDVYQVRTTQQGPLDVEVLIEQPASRGQLSYRSQSATADFRVTISGSLGSQTLRFARGTSSGAMAASINEATHLTGVVAEVKRDGAGEFAALNLMAEETGSSRFVEVVSLQGQFAVLDRNGQPATRDEGRDVRLRINGQIAEASGETAWVDTGDLAMSLVVGEDVLAGDVMDFRISGGGVLLQLDPEQPTHDPLRVGLPNLSTYRLGGPAERLFQLRTGGRTDLSSDPRRALRVLDETLLRLRRYSDHFAGLATAFDGEVVLVDDLPTGEYRLVAVAVDGPPDGLGFFKAESVRLSPDETLVLVSGVEDGATAVLRRDAESGGLTFGGLLRVPAIEESSSVPPAIEVPILSRAIEGLAKIEGFTDEIQQIVTYLWDSEDNARQQARVNARLDKIDQVASTTSFGQLHVLDGSLALTTAGVDPSMVEDLRVYRANLSATDQLDVAVQITAPASRAALTHEGGSMLTYRLILEVGGNRGFAVVFFASGTTLSQVRDEINLRSDATGVIATSGETTLTLTSMQSGSQAFASARALSGIFPMHDEAGAAATRDVGDDMIAVVNGASVTGRGSTLSFSTQTLEMSLAVNPLATRGDEFSFQITGGGVRYLFDTQDDPPQQSRLGIPGVRTSDLGSPDRRLDDFRSGGAIRWDHGPGAALRVVQQAQQQLSVLHSRLDAMVRLPVPLAIEIPDEGGDVVIVRPTDDVIYSERRVPLLSSADDGLARASAILEEIGKTVQLARRAEEIGAVDAFQARLNVLLDALDGIARGTVLDGAEVLDGSLALTAAGVDSSLVEDLHIYRADLSADGKLDVDVQIVAPASRAQITYAAGTLVADLILRVSGNRGAEVFNFGTSTTVTQIKDALNLVSDSTGVRATVSVGTSTMSPNLGGDELVLTSEGFGSGASVAVDFVIQDVGGTFLGGWNATHGTGTDVVAMVNGQPATTDGNTLAINTPALDFDMLLAAGTSADIHFTISGGAADDTLPRRRRRVRLPRVGIPSVAPGDLGGPSGTLIQLRTGGPAALETGGSTAAQIVDEAIRAVVIERAKLAEYESQWLRQSPDPRRERFPTERRQPGQRPAFDRRVPRDRRLRRE